MGDQWTVEVRRFWEQFCARSGVDPASRCDVFAFGDSPEMADELVGLVLTGPKRATAGLVWEYERSGDPLPEVGTFSVVVDGSGSPACVVETTDVQIKPLREVDAAFAWDEGEGDRTVPDWLDGHRRFFTRFLAGQGVEFSDDMPAVFERFRLVWPAAGPAGTGP
jgi:uncharacterized protein YhfF